MNKNNNKTNGVNTLPDALENVRMQVVELELKARYWKAQWEIRHYTLASEDLNEAYEVHTENLRKLNEDAFAQLKADLEKAKEAGAEVAIEEKEVENVEG